MIFYEIRKNYVKKSIRFIIGRRLLTLTEKEFNKGKGFICLRRHNKVSSNMQYLYHLSFSL